MNHLHFRPHLNETTVPSTLLHTDYSMNDRQRRCQSRLRDMIMADSQSGTTTCTFLGDGEGPGWSNEPVDIDPVRGFGMPIGAEPPKFPAIGPSSDGLRGIVGDGGTAAALFAAAVARLRLLTGAQGVTGTCERFTGGICGMTGIGGRRRHVHPRCHGRRARRIRAVRAAVAATRAHAVVARALLLPFALGSCLPCC